MADPLSEAFVGRTGSEDDGHVVPARHAVSYYRGFYDAEKRRKVVNREATPSQTIMASILSALPMACIIYFLTRGRLRRNINNSGNSAGKAKSPSLFEQINHSIKSMMDPLGGLKDFRVTHLDTKFSDVIGVPEAVQEVQQYVHFLQSPARFTRLGARLPKGCLLTGEPGTGKTLLAKAVAGEAKVPFFSCSGADFIEVYAGSGPKRVRELFAAARAESRAVIFIDEIDAVGSRSGGDGGGAMGLSSEENRTVNQLLAELDGIQPQEALLVFAATNRVDDLDKALLREGRFDRKVSVAMPDASAREQLLAHYLSRVVSAPSAPELAAVVAPYLPGTSPATIAAIVNEAALSATIAQDSAVRMTHLLPAIDDALLGKPHRHRSTSAHSSSDSGSNGDDLRIERTACRESGRALIAWLLPGQSEVRKVSIIPRGRVSGFTQQCGREVNEMPTALSLFTDVCVKVAGRVAEQVVYGLSRVSVPSSSHTAAGAAAAEEEDMQHATAIAMQAFLSFGMSTHGVGLLAFSPQQLREGRLAQSYSASMQCVAEEEAGRLVAAAMTLVREILSARCDTLTALQRELKMAKELWHSDLVRIIGSRDHGEGEDGAAHATSDVLSSRCIIGEAARVALQRFVTASEEAALQRQLARRNLVAHPAERGGYI